jgi:AcrR family transcriptional regulator
MSASSGRSSAPSSPATRANRRAMSVRRRKVDEGRRDELLARLEKLVLDEGAHLTVDELASRLQCSKSTLYAIASGKERLVTVVLKHFFRDAVARIRTTGRRVHIIASWPGPGLV